MVHGLGTAAIIGITVGSVIAGVIIIIFLTHFLRMWLRGPSLGSDCRKRLDGKVVAITGANTGIGKETALDLAKKGARVILLCRSLEKAKKAAEDIKKQFKEAQLTIHQFDLASLKSVRNCAQTLIDTEDRIDILVNNAGIMMCPEWKTEDGFDMQFGTNHLGHFLLTELITPLLVKAASLGSDARIVIVSSMAHYQGRIYWRDIHFEKKNHKYDRIRAYTQSKLANVMHARELALRLEGSGIRVVSLHPGVIKTDLHRHMYKTWWGWILWPFHHFFVKTPFFGAQTTLYCCLNDHISNGGYYSDCRQKIPCRRALDERAGKKLWDISEKMVGLRSSQSEML